MVSFFTNIWFCPLSINTCGGTEILVFQRCVAGTIERVAGMIERVEGMIERVAGMILCVAGTIEHVAGMVKHAVRIISIIKKKLYTDMGMNFVKMKQKPRRYNITSDKLEFVRNNLENYVTIFARKF